MKRIKIGWSKKPKVKPLVNWSKKPKAKVNEEHNREPPPKLSSQKKPNGGWVESEIVITTKNGDKRRAKCIVKDGLLAVHREVVDSEYWSVTATRCGLRVVKVKNRDVAVRCADILLKYAKAAWKEKEKGVVQSWVPGWVVRWIYKVNEEQGWVNTKPFKLEDEVE